MALGKREFDGLILAHLDRLYNLARWLTRNPEHTQDLVQETVLKALRARGQFRGGTSITAWLYTILRNTFVDGYWHRIREPLWPQQGADPNQVRQDIADEVDLLLGDVELARLRNLISGDINRALENLPESWRTTLLLADVEGLSWVEVSAIMGCPLGTVQSRIFRARRVLRRLLKDYAPGSGARE